MLALFFNTRGISISLSQRPVSWQQPPSWIQSSSAPGQQLPPQGNDYLGASRTSLDVELELEASKAKQVRMNFVFKLFWLTEQSPQKHFKTYQVSKFPQRYFNNLGSSEQQ